MNILFDSKKKYLYHITTKNWKNKIILSPKETGQHRSDEEGDISRICVSENVSGCIIAVWPCIDTTKKVKIYKTLKKVTSFIPSSENVPDAHITKEHWLLGDTEFICIGEVNKKLNFNSLKEAEDLIVGDGHVLYLTKQEKYYYIFRKQEKKGSLIYEKHL